ncbi:hypothetical protein RHMOL_Rhmol03G0285800 [Rhododendron molle]|uniref:Uncharacterized protein n=1 Tax=Rhododendron molle TaxID=49168 RepID=A0ACC0PLS6_RHOML|nr:hypothetical protein RHMOL_Rhmol03G0285800 [Rhododendron molle]
MEIMNSFEERNAKALRLSQLSWCRYNRNTRAGEEDDDDAQEKATAWDDWKDDNRRGVGSKKFTLCGKNAAADCFRSVMYRIEICKVLLMLQYIVLS